MKGLAVFSTTAFLLAGFLIGAILAEETVEARGR
jgi:hypothetical protein